MQPSMTRQEFVDKRAEFADLHNVGRATQNIDGWRIVSVNGIQSCNLAGSSEPGAVLRVWAMAEDAGQGGYNCGFDRNI